MTSKGLPEMANAIFSDLDCCWYSAVGLGLKIIFFCANYPSKRSMILHKVKLIPPLAPHLRRQIIDVLRFLALLMPP
jgi:hypothetical protein